MCFYVYRNVEMQRSFVTKIAPILDANLLVLFTSYYGMESLPNSSVADGDQPIPPSVVVEDKAVDLNTANEKKEEVKPPISGGNEERGNESGFETLQMGDEVHTSVGASLNSSIINMMNTIVGAGTLSLPCTVMDGGIIGAGLLLILSLALSLVGAHYLVVAASYTREDSYGFIGRRLLNKGTGYFADFFMILFDFGISVGYCNIIFSQTYDLVRNVFGVSTEALDIHNWWIYLLETLFIMFPMLSLPTIDALKWTSTIAICCIVLFVFISIFMGIRQVFTDPFTYNWLPTSIGAFSTAVSVFFTCLASHVNIPKMTSELKFPKGTKFASRVGKMDRVNNIAFVACSVIYYLVGLCGYLAYGPATEDNLLTNFGTNNTWYMNIVKLAYTFVALFSFPILSFSPLVSIDKTFFKQPRPTFRRCMEALIWSVLCYVVAMLIPQLRVIFSLTGSLCGVALVFVWPALFYIFVSKKEKAKAKSSHSKTYQISQGAVTFAWILFYVGIVMAVFMTGLEVQKLIAPTVDPTPAPSLAPTLAPTLAPSVAPTLAPTVGPSA